MNLYRAHTKNFAPNNTAFVTRVLREKYRTFVDQMLRHFNIEWNKQQTREREREMMTFWVFWYRKWINTLFMNFDICTKARILVNVRKYNQIKMFNVRKRKILCHTFTNPCHSFYFLKSCRSLSIPRFQKEFLKKIKQFSCF